MNKILNTILDLPKTLLFNFYYLPFKSAIKLPFRVSHKVHIKSLGSRESVDVGLIEFGAIRIGISEGSFGLTKQSCGWWNVNASSKVVFKGKANFAGGIRFETSKSSYIEIGDNFYCNADTIISVNKEMVFGEDIQTGWNCVFIDGDGHQIADRNSNLINQSRKITIGDHVWFAANSNVLKGTFIASGSVIGYGSIVSGCFHEENVVIAGTPAKVIKHNVNWKHDRL